MTINELLSELSRRLHKSFEAVNAADPNGQLTTTTDTRLTDDSTTTNVGEISALATQHVTDILAGN